MSVVQASGLPVLHHSEFPRPHRYAKRCGQFVRHSILPLPAFPSALRLKTHRQFYRGVFGMIAPGLRPDDQRRFSPCLAAKPLRQVFRPHHRKNGDQRFIALSEDDRTLAHDDQSRLTRPELHTLQLMRRKGEHTGKQTSRGQVFRSCETVIHHTTPHLKPAGPFLRMFTHDTIRLRPIRRTPRDEVKLFLLPDHPRLTKVPVSDLIPIQQAIRSRRATRQSYALRLGFHGHKPRTGTTPRTDHPHRPDATPQIQARLHRRCPRRPIPGRQCIIRGEAMSILQLQDPKMATKSRAGFPLARHRHRRRNWARLRPAFENGLDLTRHFFRRGPPRPERQPICFGRSHAQSLFYLQAPVPVDDGARKGGSLLREHGRHGRLGLEEEFHAGGNASGDLFLMSGVFEAT
jgi:hypothetical protein